MKITQYFKSTASKTKKNGNTCKGKNDCVEKGQTEKVLCGQRLIGQN